MIKIITKAVILTPHRITKQEDFKKNEVKGS